MVFIRSKVLYFVSFNLLKILLCSRNRDIWNNCNVHIASVYVITVRNELKGADNNMVLELIWDELKF